MANTYITIAGTTWHPELPMTVERFYTGTEKRMINGQLRRAATATKYRHGEYTSEEVSQATRDSLRAAITFIASFTYTDEAGVGRTAMLMTWTETLHRSEPDVAGATTGTGTNYYTITIKLEDV